ncbi:MAG: nuclear transport factor 2 family protein [Paraglaciecola sp.]|uniref:nuclear transport factor 2 family protein n=1 Tax=Paraglaciecola sp. TaxID=1920173 RepID=UPI003299CA72
MRKVVVLIAWLLFTGAATASSSEFDAEQFAQEYFDAWKATQSPHAVESDIQDYLSLLKDDVGHQHLPYDPDATREPDGKHKMLQGMLYYLGTHNQYTATLKSVVTGYKVVIIKYHTQSRGTHPQSGEVITLSYDTVEVLEIEDGKVAVIRKYSE